MRGDVDDWFARWGSGVEVRSRGTGGGRFYGGRWTIGGDGRLECEGMLKSDMLAGAHEWWSESGVRCRVSGEG